MIADNLKEAILLITIIDTFNEFKNNFENRLDVSIDEKILIWEKNYISRYPELEKKCKEDYESLGYHWKNIAKEMVFNRTKNDFPKMVQAHSNILEILDSVNKRVKDVFNIDLNINIVLYCGLCNSAGCVDTYDNKQAILFGIDKIAELNWHTKKKLEALLSHELCHVIHFEIRGENELPKAVENNNYNYGIWRIYTEGFAQFYQHRLLGKEAYSRDEEWRIKCYNNMDKLKELYLKALYDEEKGVNEFFGDWYKVLGISDVGYFLGERLIAIQDKKYNVTEVAKLPFEDIEQEVMEFLKK